MEKAQRVGVLGAQGGVNTAEGIQGSPQEESSVQSTISQSETQESEQLMGGVHLG